MNGNGNTAVAEAKTETTQQKETGQTLLIKPILVHHVSFGIKARGASPMVQHQWTEKSLLMLRMTAAERKKIAKTKRDPQAEAEASRYFTEDGETGFPAMALKSALITAAHKDVGLEKTLVRKAIFLKCSDPGGIIAMESDDPIIREDTVRIGPGTADLRYRCEFRNWRARVEFEVDGGLLNVQDIVNLANRAGFGVGICEWRPEKGGEWGRFEIDTSVPVQEHVA